MLSVYLGAVGVGGVLLGLGFLVQGPLALDRRYERTRSNSRYASEEDALDLHADRDLGALSGSSDELWLPLTSLHCWTIASIGFGLSGLALTWSGWSQTASGSIAALVGLAVGYAAASALRTLPAREPS